ncbi:uncharacterized protein LOC124946575 [Vespa velutina]|uniref:uncharacterized protein LOC124946575 n=1 Tax=Vespa velutina TaxID=202808 RepID=UPI001FB466D3|nr:uncharacterized protein LOC124946575 [Vespa velutina]
MNHALYITFQARLNGSRQEAVTCDQLLMSLELDAHSTIFYVGHIVSEVFRRVSATRNTVTTSKGTITVFEVVARGGSYDDFYYLTMSAQRDEEKFVVFRVFNDLRAFCKLIHSRSTTSDYVGWHAQERLNIQSLKRNR